MSELIKIITNPFFNIYYLIKSIFWKRDKSIVLFDSWFGYKFADNPRYLFQYLSENKEKLKLTHVVWVTRSSRVKADIEKLGYECYMIDSRESKYYHKHAYYHIINNSANANDDKTGELLEGYSYGAKRINLWHGVAGKGVKFTNKDKLSKYSKIPGLLKILAALNKNKFWRLFFEQRGGWGDCYYLVQSTENLNNLYKSFEISKDKFILTGYPRVCTGIKLTDYEKVLIDKIEKYDYTFLYLPTFRNVPVIDFNEIEENISKEILDKKILWIQKAHSADTINNKKFSNIENFINLDSNFDINTIIPYISCMITDYSSCFLEAIFFNKDLIFYTPDYDQYLNQDRGLTYNPEKVMAGPIIKNMDDLRNIIKFYKTNIYKKDFYNDVFDLYWKETYKKSLEDIWKDILKATNKRKRR